MTLTEEVAVALNPVLLADRLGLELEGWQREVLASRARRQILLCARQVGKSTMAAVRALHATLYRPGSLVLIVSPTESQSQETFRKVLDLNRRLGRPVPAEAESALRLELRNGSRIVALPGSETSARGYSAARLLIVDEAAWVPDALFHAVRPMIAVSRGSLLLLSTPLGRQGFFADAWLHGTGWERHKVTAEDSTRVPMEELVDARRSLAGWVYRRDYLCEFADSDAAAFSAEDIEAMFDEEVEWWDL